MHYHFHKSMSLGATLESEGVRKCQSFQIGLKRKESHVKLNRWSGNSLL